MWRRFLIAAGAFIAITMTAGGPDSARAQQINPADFSNVITNPLFPVSSFSIKVFEGREEGDDGTERTRIESRTLTRTETVGGVVTTVIEESEFVDGEIKEVARDFYAQHRNGDVYYFGETVDNYVNGNLRNHDGAWRADQGRNEAGIIMLANPTVGRTYSQEFAPSIAEDKGTIVALNESVKTPAGSFTGCVKIKDTTPLEPDVEEFKWFCPGVGMVREESEDSFSELVSFTRVTQPAASPTSAGVLPAPNTAAGALPLPQSQQTTSAPSALAAAPSTVRPPSTGDAGLLVSREKGDSPPLAALGFVAVLTGGALMASGLRGRELSARS